jgi:hypothetical protein
MVLDSGSIYRCFFVFVFPFDFAIFSFRIFIFATASK